MERVLPAVPRGKQLRQREQSFPALKEKRKKVAFFSGCLMDTMFRQTNDATIKLLQYAGCEIVVPENQNCCGALHGHSGKQEKARELARANITAFEEAGVDYIVTNAGGCGGFLVDYSYLLKDDSKWAKRAQVFDRKIVDITKLLHRLDFHKFPLKGNGETITFQDSCHLRNAQKTFIEPRELLQSIDNINYVEMRHADQCCGSAGIYNLGEPEMSMQLLDGKMQQVERTKAEIIVTANPGCYLQMKLGVERAGLTDQIQVWQMSDFLLDLYEQAKESLVLEK